MMLKVLFLSVLALASALQCPDGGMCSDDNTCCKIPSGGYSCCPLLNDISSFPMVQTGSLNDISGSVCPDNSPCPSEYSCLLTPTGEYGCCPFPQGLSCADGKHCCPDGYKCSDDGSSCTRHTVICPDKESECPDETTCCELPDGSWGCCPMVKAVCCDDKVHCCPEGTRCDIAHSKCLSHESETPMWGKLLARKRAAWENDKVTKVESVACPDGKSQCPKMRWDVICPDMQTKCPSDTTCCEMPSGSYGCCPMPQAVCCEDKMHCCPEGTKCDLPHNKCVSASGESPLFKKTPALRKGQLQNKASGVQCDDARSCADGSTCCKTRAGGWACCSLPKAVCCDDHEHCCPEDTTCDLAAGTCDQGGFSVPWLKKVPALVSEPNEEKCDDQYSCPDGNTCCKLSTGDWACCPLPHAVCCADNESCCPEGTTCDTEHKKCVSAEGETTMRKKFPAMKKNSNNGKMLVIVNGTVERDVKCDDTKSCPDGNTCCKNKQGGWGCCSFPKAVCCDDHEHCCPEDTTCDLAAGTCDQGGFSVPWLKKVPALVSEPNEEKCDNETSCPDGTTCCKLSTGDWACCPLIRAVCCDDHEHCCPKGYKCDVEQQTCVKQGLSIPWVPKKPPMKKLLSAAGAHADKNMCNEHTCPKEITCCEMRTEKWGCCPVPNGVCCNDQEHCCPQGYQCNMQTSTCERQSLVFPWVFQKAPLYSLSAASPGSRGNDKCDDQHNCSDQQTCCKTAAGTWGCCPYSQGVCCDDLQHCCPNHYTCDKSGGKCVQSNGLSWDVLFSNKRRQFNTL